MGCLPVAGGDVTSSKFPKRRAAYAQKQKIQSKHDTEVRKIATEHKRKGHDVDADLRGFPSPETIRDYRPDVIARKGQERRTIRGRGRMEPPPAKQEQATRTVREQAQLLALDRAA